MAAGIEIAKPFVQATIHVLSTMAGLSPTAGKPYIKNSLVAQGDVSAIVGVTGFKNGTISVTFTRTCAVALVKGMLGNDIQDILQDTKDAVGEITNMISGQARGGLAEMGMNFQGSTPTVIMGDNHTISHCAKGPVVAVPFSSEHGDFTLEFSFED